MGVYYIRKIILLQFCSLNELEWELSSGVNILSGVNGSGKSTLIRAMASLLGSDTAFQNSSKPYGELRLEFEDGSIISSLSSPNEEKSPKADFITTFDSPLQSSEALQKISGGKINSELDWELYKVLDKYIKYQLMIGKQAIELLLSGEREEGIKKATEGKTLFFDTLDALFADSNKTVNRKSDYLSFFIGKKELEPYQLSSGEKQLVIILTSVLIQNGEKHIMIMDEPEISLHHQWQRKLIASIMALNPQLQLILTTHSPALIMDGWMDRITDMSEIVC